MKKQFCFFATLFTFFLITSLSVPVQKLHPAVNCNQDTLVTYMDGSFTGQSRAMYTDESYWGKVQISIKNGKFSRIKFMIRDSDLHETFTDQYKVHFKDNAEYMKQCENDWKGVKKYPKRLKKAKNIENVDAITGATWSYHIFKASLEEALNKAKEK
jgi:major membrane immunogen (membrane-anchored lipoprotein)